MRLCRRAALPLVPCLAAGELLHHLQPAQAPSLPRTPAFSPRLVRAGVRCTASLPGAMLAGLKKALGQVSKRAPSQRCFEGLTALGRSLSPLLYDFYDITGPCVLPGPSQASAAALCSCASLLCRVDLLPALIYLFCDNTDAIAAV